MHFLITQPKSIENHDHKIHFHQTPGEIVFLSAADSDLMCFADAYDSLGEDRPSLRLGNLLGLQNPEVIDHYIQNVLSHARIIIVRVLGGYGYWSYGIEQIRRLDVLTAFLPGDMHPDTDLSSLSTLGQDERERLWHYLVYGGVENTVQFLKYTQHILGYHTSWEEPKPFSQALLYWPKKETPTLEDIQEEWTKGAPVVGILFYRALLQSGNLDLIDALIGTLQKRNLNPFPIAVISLREPVSASLVREVLREVCAEMVINTTSFAVGQVQEKYHNLKYYDVDCPVLQVVVSSDTQETWKANQQGLSARDIAMNVALPEVDGRIMTRAVCFKTQGHYHKDTQCCVVGHQIAKDRIEWVALLAYNWVTLRRTPLESRRVVMILANYPNKDGRLGNGVGLDTPTSVVDMLRLLQENGYYLEDVPQDSESLMTLLQAGVTVANHTDRVVREWLDVDVYRRWFEGLSKQVQHRITERWGQIEEDPWIQDGTFVLPFLRFGHIIIGIQPSRGYNIDSARSYHDPALPPPHHYCAFYAWICGQGCGFGAHAVIHFGKHGNLEWLPGKGVALSQECFPEALFAPVPHLYPFIVNDPGEGSQAKRRTAAVIIDHLTPPLARAETHGILIELENLIEEYEDARLLDPRRLPVLHRRIVEIMTVSGLDQECALRQDMEGVEIIGHLNTFLCEIKELQIRTGLHIFGRPPQGENLTTLLVALSRLPRGRGQGRDASLTRALALDLGLDFDPLSLDATGPVPVVGEGVSSCVPRNTWRKRGDTLAWIEELAQKLVSKTCRVEAEWTRTQDVLSWIDEDLRPKVLKSADAERESILRGLDGRFIAPGPAGAPTRGRPEVLPTGRNFYSIDPRMVPTPTAYRLGWESASLLIERYQQEYQTFPQRIALSAWGTANMRTGGDDIAQALALMGVRPTWDSHTGRVCGFEIIPPSVLGRPRVDVTLRISGFFRDAFPYQIDLLDSAVRAVSLLEEDQERNPLAAKVKEERERLCTQGVSREVAERCASYRIFGARPGSYGAGLQALMDQGGWENEDDLARAFLVWGGYAYGVGVAGLEAEELFKRRLEGVEMVVHNQDNREHDLLDSDDYYQFEGGLTVTVKSLSGRRPQVYHTDHSRPEHLRVRTLEQEISRVVWGRVVNPKWIKGMMGHGYKGGFELAATVDYMFAFAATTAAVKDQHFDAAYDAYIENETVRTFMERYNKEALREMASRFLEAQRRGLWRPRSNSSYAVLSELELA